MARPLFQQVSQRPLGAERCTQVTVTVAALSLPQTLLRNPSFDQRVGFHIAHPGHNKGSPRLSLQCIGDQSTGAATRGDPDRAGPRPPSPFRAPQPHPPPPPSVLATAGGSAEELQSVQADTGPWPSISSRVQGPRAVCGKSFPSSPPGSARLRQVGRYWG